MHPVVGASITMYSYTFHHSYVSRVTAKFFYSSETFSRSLTASCIGSKKIATHKKIVQHVQPSQGERVRESLSVSLLLGKWLQYKLAS